MNDTNYLGTSRNEAIVLDAILSCGKFLELKLENVKAKFPALIYDWDEACAIILSATTTREDGVPIRLGARMFYPMDEQYRPTADTIKRDVKRVFTMSTLVSMSPMVRHMNYARRSFEYDTENPGTALFRMMVWDSVNWDKGAIEKGKKVVLKSPEFYYNTMVENWKPFVIDWLSEKLREQQHSLDVSAEMNAEELQDFTEDEINEIFDDSV